MTAGFPTFAGRASVRLLLLLCAGAIAACSGVSRRLEWPTPLCRAATRLNVPVKWLGPSDPYAIEGNGAYCDAVGPLAIAERGPAGAPRDGDLLIVSWNMAVGAGDLERLLQTLESDERSAGRGSPDFVILLQEAYRIGDAVPPRYAPHARAPTRIAHGRREGRDVVSLAERLQMHFVYAPSMRNGAVDERWPAEDRGNAILSTLPLQDFAVVELPFEHQRRVAVTASVATDGARLTLASVHLDTRRPLLRGSIFAGPAGRHRQAVALRDALATLSGGTPAIVGGDFNTIGGSREPAIRSFEERFARVGCGSPHTHWTKFHLDYLFATNPSLLTRCDRPDERFDSDHHPLVARLRR